MARKILILAGAPACSSLDWNTANLLDSFLEPVARFAGLYDISPSAIENGGDESNSEAAVWRSIPLERTQLPTGFSQVHEFEAEYIGDQNFFTTFSASQETFSSPEEDGPSQQLLDQFYHHSLAIHESITSSQLPTASFSTFQSSFATTESGSFDSSTPAPTSGEDRTLGMSSAHLSDLEDLPNAAFLQSISPQTMSVNLIVGIISVAEPRTVKTRWGTTKSLVELVVGDETRSGFSVTFWLSREMGPAEAIASLQHDTLRGLRRQDIILLRNVALSHFMKKVHGHSLRKGLTKVDLLYSRKTGVADVGGLYSAKELASNKSFHPQLLKTKRVREWVLNFVGGGPVLGKRKEKGKAVRSWDMPPDDTLP